MLHFRHSIPAALVLCAIAVPVSAQEILHDLHGTAAGQRYGFTVDGAGDVNGDGFGDLVVGAPFDSVDGRAYVVSGADGSILFTLTGDAASDRFGRAVAGIGDLNMDGTPDVAVGDPEWDGTSGPNAGRVWVFSGVDGSILRTWRGADNTFFGRSVAGAGDVDGDGFADVIVGIPLADDSGDDSGRARVFSGATGGTLYTFEGNDPGDEFGTSVGGGMDYNGDGFDDVVVGAPFFDNPAGLNAGQARVISGATGLNLKTFEGSSPGENFGCAVAGLGDLANDGFGEVAIGASGAKPSGVDSGQVTVVSGLGNSVLFVLDGENVFDNFGISVAGAGDTDGDGVLDILVGAFGDDNGGNARGSASVYSGATGALVLQVNGAANGDELGWSVGGAGDVNNDGFADIIAGTPGDDTNGANSGGARVVSGKPFLVLSSSQLSAAAGGNIDFDMDFPLSEAGRNYALLGSSQGTGPTVVNGVAIPLTRDSLFNGMAANNPPNGFSNTIGLLDASGDGQANLSVPAGAAANFIGRTFFWAAVSYDPPRAARISSGPAALEVLP